MAGLRQKQRALTLAAVNARMRKDLMEAALWISDGWMMSERWKEREAAEADRFIVRPRPEREGVNKGKGCFNECCIPGAKGNKLFLAFGGLREKVAMRSGDECNLPNERGGGRKVQFGCASCRKGRNN